MPGNPLVGRIQTGFFIDITPLRSAFPPASAPLPMMTRFSTVFQWPEERFAPLSPRGFLSCLIVLLDKKAMPRSESAEKTHLFGYLNSLGSKHVKNHVFNTYGHSFQGQNSMTARFRLSARRKIF